MNLHVLFLIAVTGLFASAWSMDSPPETSSRCIADAGRPERECGLVHERQARPSGVATADSEQNIPQVAPVQHRPSFVYLRPANNVRRAASDSSVNFVTVDSCPAPLPSDITVGRYRVVDRHGKILTLVVSDADAECLGLPDSPSASLSYISRSGSRQWHFVRFDSPHDSITATGNSATPTNECHRTGTADDTVPLCAPKMRISAQKSNNGPR